MLASVFSFGETEERRRSLYYCIQNFIRYIFIPWECVSRPCPGVDLQLLSTPLGISSWLRLCCSVGPALSPASQRSYSGRASQASRKSRGSFWLLTP
jgi:hypothetical protein